MKMVDTLQLISLICRQSKEVGTSHNKVSLMTNLPARNKTLTIAVKNYTKDFKVFLACPIFVDFFTLFQMFRPRFFVKTENKRLSVFQTSGF